MGIQTQSALVASVLLLALGLNAAFQQRRVKDRVAFSAMVFAFFAYDLSFFLNSVVGGTFWSRALLVSGIAVAQTTLRFFQRFLDRRHDWVQPVATVLSVVAVVLSVTRLADGPMVGLLVAVLAVGSYGYCIWLLYQRRQEARGTPDARRMLFLVVGGALSVGFGALDLLALAGIPVPALGHLLTTIYLYLLMQVVQRSRLLDLQELVGRGLVLIVQALLVSVAYALLLVWVGDQLGLFFYNTFLASVALVLAYEPLQRAIDALLGRLLFGAKYEFQAHLARLRQDLTNVINLGDLVGTVMGQLADTRRVTHASLFLLEDEGHAYFRAGAEGPCEVERVGVVKARAFLDALREESVLVLDHVEKELEERRDSLSPPERARLEMIRDMMNDMSAGLTFALRSGERLLGWLNVRDERFREPYSSFEIAQLAAVTVQIAAVVENSELFERLKERDRLSAIGEMATGMAHEIRNPLGAIKAAAQLLDPSQLDAEDQEFVDVILEETDRLNHVLSQFLDFARPFRGALEPMDLEKVIHRVATLIRTEERAPPIEVQVRTHGLPEVLGDANALHQVLLNLARNACDAMPDGGTLTLIARPVPGDANRVEVLVTDTGQGIPPDVRSSLFIPFFTTKSGGTGLGLPISQRIVRHHGSTLRVDSTPGEGTTMRFSLPVASRGDTLTGEHRRRLATETA